MLNENILHVENLGKEFASTSHRLTVLSGVSFELAQGESCALVGPSGSGKTTLLGLCAGLDEPSHGSVHLLGRNLAQLRDDDRARLRRDEVGFVFQSFQLMPTLTALENVLVPLELKGEGRASVARASDILSRVGLADRLDHYPSQLSGGEQQRVALARAFVHRPRILFADEPTGNLDEETAANVIDLLFELNRDAQTTLFLVTHDAELATKCGRVIRLRGGRVVA